MDSTNLKWVQWQGKLPDDAVSIYNDDAKRTDYVARYDGNGGFYTPDKGPYCYYPWGDKAHKDGRFDILVNEGNLEHLEWREGSHGKVPKNSVHTSTNGYVGKNKHGLGKVSVKNEAFFVIEGNKEKCYKDYEVLTYNPVVVSQRITNVVYNTESMEIVKLAPEVIVTSSVDNHGSSPVKETVKLEKTLQEQKKWDFSAGIKLGVTASMTAGMPDVASVGVQFSVEKTFKFSQGATKTESKSQGVFTHAVFSSVETNSGALPPSVRIFQTGVNTAIALGGGPNKRSETQLKR